MTATLDSIASQLAKLGREIQTLQRAVDGMHAKLPPGLSRYDSDPEYPWVEPYVQLFEGLPKEPLALRVTTALDQALRQADAAFRDISAARAKIDQMVDGSYSSTDMREWINRANRNEA